MRETLLFCFNLKKSAAESHWSLWRPLATIFYRKQHAEIGFAGSMTTILTWVTRSVKIDPGRLRTVNCRLFWTRTIPNRKKCLPSNWVFLEQPFPCGYMPWGRFKRSENGYRMNWKIGRWSDAKTHAKFCLPDKKERRSCIGLWQAMKSGSIFRILNARNLGLIPPNHQHLPQDQIASDDAVRLVGSGGCHLLRAVNAHRYHQQLIKLHRALREKRPHYRKRHDKLISTTTPHRTRQQWSKTTWRHSTEKFYPTYYPTYSPDLAPSDYHLFSSMGHALAEQHFHLTKTFENDLMSGLPRKMRNFFGMVYTNCLKDGKNV